MMPTDRTNGRAVQFEEISSIKFVPQERISERIFEESFFERLVSYPGGGLRVSVWPFSPRPS